jgi:hypothetical protein
VEINICTAIVLAKLLFRSKKKDFTLRSNLVSAKGIRFQKDINLQARKKHA